MAFDFKKECKELYQPKMQPAIIAVPAMKFIAVRGAGDPNTVDGEYQRAVSTLYAVAYTIKMSKKGEHQMPGYFDFTVPPLEGFWWQDGLNGVDYSRKQDFRWISAIRMPDFVTQTEFEWAKAEAERKKQLDLSAVGLVTIDEGECVQAMHVGPYDDEPATVARMHAFLQDSGYMTDFSDERHHHEIYLSDPRRVDPAKMKTVIRHPVKRI